jgi:hypothetical protein
VKKKLLEDLMARLTLAGLNRENVFVVFKETAWENLVLRRRPPHPRLTSK